MRKILLAALPLLVLFASCDLINGSKKSDPVAKSITVSSNSSKLDYIEGEVFEPAGMTVEVVYNDGSKKVIEDYSYTSRKLTAEDKEITVTKDDFSAVVPVKVTAVVGVEFDYTAIKAGFGEFAIEGPEGTYEVADGTVTLSPAEEKTEYVISGYFKGQIVNNTKNTKLTLNNAYLENDSSNPVIYSVKKLEISSEKNTVNYLVSSGTDSKAKTAAVLSEKGLEMGGNGTVYILGNLCHGAKGSEIKAKGSGRYIIRGTSGGSAVNCNGFLIEAGKSVKLFLVDSKNGIKADETISVASGSLYFGNIGTAFKTDTTKDDATLTYSISLADCNVYSRNVSKSFSTEEGCYSESNVTSEEF